MASHEYHFFTHWRMASTPEEVYRIIENTPDLPRWWPAVWLKIEMVEPGDADGVGSLIRLHSKGWLPYTLCWLARSTEKKFPHRIAFEASGDFEGRGCWSFTADGDFVDMQYEWHVRADKWLLRYFSFVLRPIFAANHNWAMAQGKESLLLELARRHAGSPEERAAVPAPRGPTFCRRRVQEN